MKGIYKLENDELTKRSVHFVKDEIGWIKSVQVVQGQDSDAILELIAPLKMLRELRAGGVTKKGVAFFENHKHLESLEIYGDTLEQHSNYRRRAAIPPRLPKASLPGSFSN